MASSTYQHNLAMDLWGVPPVYVRLKESLEELVESNPNLRIEQTSTGEVVFMTPTGGESGRRNSIIVAILWNWSQSNGGHVFDSSTLFQLPNGAKRSPDAAWVADKRWQQLSAKQRQGYPPLCPDLVVELRSESDRLVDLQEKLDEYMSNGAQLGWLIDPLLKQIHVYRPDEKPERLDSPNSVSGGNLLPGLTVDLSQIWA